MPATRQRARSGAVPSGRSQNSHAMSGAMSTISIREGSNDTILRWNLGTALDAGGHGTEALAEYVTAPDVTVMLAQAHWHWRRRRTAVAGLA